MNHEVHPAKVKRECENFQLVNAMMKRPPFGMTLGHVLLFLFSAWAADAQEASEIPLLHLGYENAVPEPSASSHPGPRTAARVAGDEGSICTTIDFEGVGNLVPIPEFDGIVSPGWLGIIDADAGGTGNFANEPSPETIAFWLDPGFPSPGTDDSRDILFDEPAAIVEFFYTSSVTTTVSAFDGDDNLVASVTGPSNVRTGPGGDPTGSYNQFDPLRVEAAANVIVRVNVSGAQNRTGIDDLKVCRKTGVHSIEFTQAIQEWQDLAALQSDLADDREPPVPIVAGKLAAMRVMFNEVQAVTTVKVEVEVSGKLPQSRRVVLQPGCSPNDSRRGRKRCKSVDFNLIPAAGDWEVNLRVLDQSGGVIEQHNLKMSSRDVEPLALVPISVCHVPFFSPFSPVCEPGSSLSSYEGFLRGISPTDSVTIANTGHFVELFTGPSLLWWLDIAVRINTLWVFHGFPDSIYHGMVHVDAPGGLGSLFPINGIGFGNGAASRVRHASFDGTARTITHETGHALGRSHTNTAVPQTACTLAPDDSTDWPYDDNRIQEVGFDVRNGKLLLPETTFDYMSYCHGFDTWVSPHTYRRVMTELGTSSQAASRSAASAASAGTFWNLSGVIYEGALTLSPVFTVEAVASTASGTGAYRVEVRGSGDTLLFTRFFDPQPVGTADTAGEDITAELISELIPLQLGATQILVKDPSGLVLGSVSLGGADPAVTITSPPAGSTLFGEHLVRWQITDPDSANHASRVEYSPDGGATVHVLALDVDALELAVDFDDLPSCATGCLLRVLASDGANTGVGLLTDFTVPPKLPSVEIAFPPPDSIFGSSAMIWFQAIGADPDAAILPDGAFQWESDVDGLLGTGSSLPVTLTSAGTHTITVTLTDADGNSAAAYTTLTLAGDAPALELDVVPLDTLPTTCVSVTIGALPGSVPIESVQYSLDAGASFVEIPLERLPFAFIVPGKGFFHLVARTFDAAGQLAADDDRFFIDSECVNQAPIALCQDVDVPTDAGVCYASFASVDAGSFDPDGDPITIEELPAGPYTLGTTPVSLSVFDDQGASDSCEGFVTVIDEEPPEVACAASQVLECTTPSGTTASFEPTAGDNCSDDVQTSCAPESGTTFSLGATPITCVATDDSGNTAGCDTSVTVIDTTPPAITCPASQIRECTGPDGATASFAATASDVCFDDLQPTCTPGSGAIFSLGMTTVACDTTDGAGNPSSCDFDVTVQDTTAPQVTAALNAKGRVEEDEGKFRVAFSCSDACDTAPSARATLNGIPVPNEQLVKLEIDNHSEVKFRRRIIKLEAPAFTLEVECEDSAGNLSTATAAPAFRSDDDDDRDRRHGRRHRRTGNRHRRQGGGG